MLEDEYLHVGAAYERLYREYKKHGSLCIGFDFDGTVHDFHKKGVTYPKMIELLRDLKKLGCKLICWTAYRDHAYVIDYLLRHDIPCDGVNTNGLPLPYESRKPFFSALLDDRSGLIEMYYTLRKLVDTLEVEQPMVE